MFQGRDIINYDKPKNKQNQKFWIHHTNKWSFRSSSACCDVFTTSIGVAITCDRLEHRPPATKNPTGPSSPRSRAGLGKVGTTNGGSACSVRVDGKRGVFRTGPRSPRFDGTRGRRWGGAKARCKEANRTLRLEKKPARVELFKTIWKKKTGSIEVRKILQMSINIYSFLSCIHTFKHTHTHTHLDTTIIDIWYTNRPFS